jgi:hypothetical protein
MTDIILTQNRSSDNPFETIKHIENGNEVWYARELMPLLGYKSWQKFNYVIETAHENIETITESVINHITPTDKMVNRSQGGGRNQLDYKLSRLACYHIALSCDSRGNDSVKIAKHYFAVKTREAEVKIPQQSEEIAFLRLQNDILDKQLKLRELDNTMLVLHGKATVLALRGYDQAIVEVEKPVLEVIDQRSGDRRKGMTCKQLNDYVKTKLGYCFKNGSDLKRFLEKKAPELIDIVQRPINQDWVGEENIQKAFNIIEQMPRQMLLGE